MALASRHQERKGNLNRFDQKWVKIKPNSTAGTFPHPIKAPVISSHCLKGTNLTQEITLFKPGSDHRLGQRRWDESWSTRFEGSVRAACLLSAQCVKLQSVCEVTGVFPVIQLTHMSSTDKHSQDNTLVHSIRLGRPSWSRRSLYPRMSWAASGAFGFKISIYGVIKLIH